MSNIQLCAARFQSNVFSLLGFTQRDKTEIETDKLSYRTLLDKVTAGWNQTPE